MIGYYVHHHGAGHLTRATQIAAHLEVTGFGSMPRPANWRGDWIELPRDDQGHPADPTAGGVLHWVPLHDAGLRERMARIAAWIQANNPEAFVVDVSVEVTLLARLLGAPVIVMAMRGERTDRAHLAAYDAASALVAPWPGHLPEAWPAQWLDKTTHVGAISRFDGWPLTPPVARAEPVRRVSLLWGRGGEDITAAEVSAAQAATPGWVWSRPDPELGAPGVWRALLDADVVVTHGGQNAVAEVAAAGRPAVVVASERPFAEQEHTRRALEHDGIAVGVAGGWPEPHRWAGLLEHAAGIGGQGWRRWSFGDGARRAAEVIGQVAARLSSGSEAASSHHAREPRATGLSVGEPPSLAELPTAGPLSAEDSPGAQSLALITLVRGRHEHLRGLISGLLAGGQLPDRFIVVSLGDPQIHDVVAATVGGSPLRWQVVDLPVAPEEELPLAAGRNAGVAAARETGCEYLVLLDVDCIPGPQLIARYREALRGGLDAELPARGAGPRLWCGPVTYLPPREPGQVSYDVARLGQLGQPHPARPAPPPDQAWPAQDLRLFWSLSFAVAAQDWESLGGFCESYVGYGAEDTDFAELVRAADGDMIWLGGADAYHQHHPSASPPVQHLGSIIRNAKIFASRWGWFPMQGWLEAFAQRGLVYSDDTGWHLTPLGVQSAGEASGAVG
ncbi:glycosyltransferase [Gephyromycinifex aptenodytis]|uniref:glycosyltransferase n=1 Tax=Gephyromycinifex aptenodytis TaxID=2716227 RepID=UPI0029CA3E8B|nr:glycosyltransferase [Gephyromycinifex aptenodytis]